MTKEIIINGIDISECNYAILPQKQCPMKSMPYAKETSCIACKEHNTKLNFCKNNPNCYYKQFKRKEQECKELYKEKIKLIDKSIEQKCKIKELIDENATKEVIYKINGKCAKTVANKVKEIRKIVEGKDCKWSKYKQSLDEIEEFCKQNHYCLESEYRWFSDEIQDIINKVKESE